MYSEAAIWNSLPLPVKNANSVILQDDIWLEYAFPQTDFVSIRDVLEKEFRESNDDVNYATNQSQ